MTASHLVLTPLLSDVDSTSDGALVLRARQGDTEAFGRLVERHRKGVVRIVSGVLRNPARAEDLAQETFVRAWKKLHLLKHVCAFGGWLRRMAKRLACNAIRDLRVRHSYEDEAGIAHLETQLHQSPEGGFDAGRTVWKALDQLSVHHRELLILRYLEEWTVEELARHHGIQLSAAKMRLKRARTAFQAMVSGGA